MKERSFLLVILFWGLFSPIMWAQYTPPDDFVGLFPESPIPDKMITTSTSKYVEETGEELIGERGNTKRDKDQFFLQSNFVLDELLRSGKVLFNDPVSDYLNDILQVILADHPVLRDELTVYAIRSSAVNAFATDRGSLFMNLGLVAKAKTEAELAFILCHEVVHYVHRHNLETFVEYAKIERGEGVFEKDNSYEQLLSKNNYSKTLETQADDEGLEFYLQTKYSLESVTGAFDLLAFAHIPYLDTPFDKAFLEGPTYQIPENYLLDSVNVAQPYEDDDELSTHTSVASRRESLFQQFQGVDSVGRKPYLVGEEKFQVVRSLARMELGNILLENFAYPDAIYHAFLLEQEFPDHPFIDQLLAKAWYGIAQYDNAKRTREIYNRFKIDEIQGEIQQVYYIIKKLDDEELNALASRFCFSAYLQDTTSRAMRLRAKDMIEDLVIYEIEEPEKYFEDGVQPDSLGKKQSFGNYVLGSYWDHPTMQEWLESGRRYRKKFEYDEEDDDLIRNRRQEQLDEYKHGYYLGLDEVLFVNPLYRALNFKKEVPVQYVESEDRQGIYKEMIQRNADRLDLKVDFRDVQNLRSDKSIKNYLEIVTLENWIEEFFSHDMYMITSNYEQVQPIMESLGNPKLVYSGVISARFKTSARKILGTVIYLATIYGSPAGVHNMVNPEYGSVFFTAVFNVEEHRILLENINYMDVRDKNAVIESNLYWTLLQIKRRPKK
ncbi:MAG: M48 family metallopeptidase [Bacteroidota bacterium]